MKPKTTPANYIFALPLLIGLGGAANVGVVMGQSIHLDQNFNAPFFATPAVTGRAVQLPDGKFAEFFNTDTNAATNTSGLVRFNADGTLDTTFRFKSDYAVVSAVAGIAGGKLIIAAGKTVYAVPEPNQHQKVDILRLNADGSIDSTFGPAQSTDGGEVRVMSIDPQGNVLVGGLFTQFNGNPAHGIVRLLPNGTIDPNFATVSMTCPQFPFLGSGCGVTAPPVVDSNSNIIIAGDFLQVNGVDRLCVARLNSDGTLDQTFVPSGYAPRFLSIGSPTPIRGVGIQSDGKIIIGGRFNGQNGPNRVPLVRLNTDGSRDNNFAEYTNFLPPVGLAQVRDLVIQPDDKVIAVDLSVWRFNTDGSLDSTFHNPSLTFIDGQTCDPFGACGGEAFNIAFANGGTKLFIGGGFGGVDNSAGERWSAAKLNATDGSLDASFATSGRTGVKIEPNSFLRTPPNFTLVSFANNAPAVLHLPVISHGLGRVDANGVLDLSFDPVASFSPSGPLGPNFIASGFTALADGSTLVTGQNGNTANYNHLLSNSTEDPNFHPDASVRFATAVARDDGKLVLGQYDPNFDDPNLFSDPNAQAALNGTEVRRLNADGSLDTIFQLDQTIVDDTQKRDGSGNLNSGTDPSVGIYVGSRVLALTANNTVLFAYLSQDGSYHLVRLNSDGSKDLAFHQQTFPVQLSFIGTNVNDPRNGGAQVRVNHVYSATDIPVKQAKNVLDNKVVLMGSFSGGIMRLNADGSIDSTFNVGAGPQWTQTPVTSFRHPSIDNLEVGLDDKLLLAGTFEAFNSTAAPGIINLNPDGTIDSNFVAPVTRQKFDYQPAYLKRQKDGSFILSGPYSRAGQTESPSFLRLLPPPGVPTPTGANQTVSSGPVGGASNVNVTFNSVNSAGETNVALIDPQWAGQMPPGYTVDGANLAFEIYTTCSYTAPVTICFNLPSLDNATFAAARILHNDGTGLTDVTSSKNLATKTICATVNSLSPFVIAKPPAATPVISPNGGVFKTQARVTLSDATSKAVIHYTTDGSTPTVASPVYKNTFDLKAPGNFVVNAIATAPGYNVSAVASARFTVKK